MHTHAYTSTYACTLQVIDVVKLFDRDAGSELSIDGVEFYDAIRTHFGYKGSKWVIDGTRACGHAHRHE